MATATATAAPPTATTKEDAKARDLASVLGVEEMLLEALRAQVPDLDIAKAWADGRIEFGHQQYCCTGPVSVTGDLRPGSALVIELGMTWTGPKTKLHKSFRDLVKEEPVVVEKYKRYEWFEPQFSGDEKKLKAVDIPKEVALKAIALKVRLTDKGLGDAN